MNGVVKIYFTFRGYGFIDGEDGNSYYFHIKDTNLDQKNRYYLDAVGVVFTPHIQTIDNVVRNYASEVVIRSEGMKVNGEKVSVDKVPDLLRGKVITDFKMESILNSAFRMYVMKVKDPETGEEMEVSFPAA